MSGGWARVAVVFALPALAACGNSRAGRPAAPADTAAAEAGPLVLPPSASASRATQPPGSPDTLRPATADSAAGADSLAPPPPPPSAAFDLASVADDYRRQYERAWNELGSSVRGGVDPSLVTTAKRRVAADWGYTGPGGWEDMVADMTRDQRIVLADRIAAMDRILGEDLHGRPGGEAPPE